MSRPFSPLSTQQLNPDDLLNKFVFEDGNRNIFHLGCFSERVTISSQQQRSLNLAWALSESGYLNSKRILIVGAGFAGIMLASALKVLCRNCDIQIFDLSGESIRLQEGNVTRFVQPFIYDWPESGARYPRTDFPYLNWHSAPAGMVARTVRRQWERLGIKIQRREVLYLRSGFPIKIRCSDGVSAADLVVLAVGPGLESKVSKGIPSYWSNDNLDQPLLGKGIPADVLVSGYGDGGLIDVVRASIREFDHQEFQHALISDWQTNAVLVEAARQSELQNADWHSIPFSAKLLDDFKKVRRSDTRVVFNVGAGWFTTRGSSLLNRLVVAVLAQNQDIEFLAGRIKADRIKYRDNKFEVPVERGKYTEILKFDHVVIRHGTEGACKKLLLSPVWRRTERKWFAELKSSICDLTALSHYPENFLKDRFLSYLGELEYEVIFLCLDKMECFVLLERIKKLVNNRKRLRAIVSTFFDYPEYLPPTAGIITAVDFPNRSSCFLRITTSSRCNLESFMKGLDGYPYFTFGIKISSKLYEEFDTEDSPYVPYLFPGPATRLTITRAERVKQDQRWWLRLVQTMALYPLKDAHNLMSADDMLSVARKHWTLNRMILIGWNMLRSPSENRENYTRY